MTRKYLVLCLSIILILIGIYFFSRKQVGTSFLSVATNPTDLVDVFDLSEDDYGHISEGKYNEVFLTENQNQKQVYYNDKPLRSLALSSSQKQIAFFYLSNDQSSEELSLILLDRESGQARQIYHTQSASWDVTSSIHWLGNNHLSFLRHCGTACQGVSLLNIETGETTNATLSYPSFPDQPEVTHFRDWFGKEFVISGLVDRVESETVDNLHYLVFRIKDYKGNFLGEKRFQFMETEIVEL